MGKIRSEVESSKAEIKNKLQATEELERSVHEAAAVAQRKQSDLDTRLEQIHQKETKLEILQSELEQKRASLQQDISMTKSNLQQEIHSKQLISYLV